MLNLLNCENLEHFFDLKDHWWCLVMHKTALDYQIHPFLLIVFVGQFLLEYFLCNASEKIIINCVSAS